MMDGQSGDITVTSSNRKSSAVTGSARKIKDNAADWHNLMMRWDKLNDEGFNSATNIVNIRLTRSTSDQRLLADESSSSSSAPSGQTGGAAELQYECSRLQDVVEKMVTMVTKMERLMTTQQGIQELEAFQFGPDGRTVPLFHTWSTKHFEDSSRVLLEAYRQELRLKQMVLQEVAHTATSDLCMVYLSCWLHQPFIPTQTRLTLEALLLETGHRPL
ncbi:cyclin-dependent kinase 2-interacting protein isoform X2 [Notolabrus celidotus]|uniref:cyclin-dependent kinase 2-interacting protein isoform X2 n=1 Tax=Notolabrus celidotus TaxID=1203425 RepID=UPI00148F9CD6|nr:cyclin-dependent kinase 2-interacting protein isoform X2 [Notolabrus celidotus]